ncbi:hypothetical protein DYB28_015716, partial [Aphanomyces astaci]
MPTLREMSVSSSVESVPHGEPLLSSVESVPHGEPLSSIGSVLHGKPLSSVESMSSVELLSSVGSMPHGEPLPLTFDAFALGRATRPKRVKPPGRHRVLSRAQESLAALGMIMELAKHDLLLSPNQQQVFGSRVLEPHSQRVYKKHYRGLWYFFGLIGDYTSLLILRHDCPQHAPAMSVKSLSTWQTWWKKRHLYLNATRNKKRPTLGGQGRPSSILFGSELLAFMQAVRHESHFLTTAHLVTWIKKHQHEWLQGYMSTKTSDIHAYHALIGLCQRFAHRHGFSQRIPCFSKLKLLELEQVRTTFAASFWVKHDAQPLRDIVNVDETAVFYDMPSRRTWCAVGEDSNVEASEKH